MGGSGYWRASSGDDETGANPARQPGGQDDASPGPADQPAETASAKGSPAGTTDWLNLDKQSDEAIIQFLGLDRTDRVPQSRTGHAEAAKHADTPAEAELESPAGHEPELPDQQPPRERLPRDSAEAVERFEPRQANLPEVTREEAADYLRDNADRRPWLKPAERSPADVQHVIAGVDQGGGHALERHEGYTSGERLERRVGGLEDPAQLDPELRAQGLDARKPDKLHPCKDTATSIGDPKAFAAAFARGIEHPDVRATLDRPRQPYENPPPESVEVPIEELLGEDGHRLCAGYRLLPIDGDLKAAEDNREAWITATPDERLHMASPQTEPIPAEEFQGGTIVFGFRRTDDHGHWEIVTMFPMPRDRNEQQP